MENINLEKKHAAKAAAQLIKNGMTVGLGTGSTVNYFLDALANRISQENLKIIGVTTSFKTAGRAKSLGITIIDIDDAPMIDLTVDGADEVDCHMNGIKGKTSQLFM